MAIYIATRDGKINQFLTFAQLIYNFQWRYLKSVKPILKRTDLMKIVSSYVHALEGRLRIKIPEVKGAPSQAWELESHLRLLTGLEEVAANPVTGNVLILYNPSLLREDQIISTLQELGYLEEALPKAKGEGMVERLTTVVASSIMEVALTRLVTALI
jgi:hypothetical protein